MAIQQLPPEAVISVNEVLPPVVIVNFRTLTRESDRRIGSIMESDFGEPTGSDTLTLIGNHLSAYLGEGIVYSHSSSGDSIHITLSEDRPDEAVAIKHIEDFLHNRLGLRVRRQPTGPQPRQFSHDSGRRP